MGHFFWDALYVVIGCFDSDILYQYHPGTILNLHHELSLTDETSQQRKSLPLVIGM